MSDTQSGAELLASIKPTLREGATNICLRPDLLDEWETLNTELADLVDETPTNQRLAGAGPSAAAKTLARKIQKVEKQIEDTQIRFVFRAMPKDKWQALTTANPPRDKNQMDAFMGYDRDAVVDAALRKCLVSPTFNDCSIDDCDHTSCGSWQQLEAVCNPSEWAELRKIVDEVNSVATSVPKSLLASRILGKPARG